MIQTRLRLAALGVLAVAAAVAAVPAGAQEAKPAPTSCAGLTFTDPPGDAKISALVIAGQAIGPPGETPPNLDLTSGFFRYAPDATGKNVLTANLEVAKMDKTIASGFDGAVWTMYFEDGDTLRFVRGQMDDAGAFTWQYGTFATNRHTVEGDTKGTVYEGDKGIVSVVVPPALKLDGKTLTGTYAEARAAGGGFIFPTDRGPDSESGKDFKANPCAEAGVPTDTTPPPPDGTQPPPNQPTQPQQPAAPVTFKVTAPKLSARKLKKGRKFSVTVQSSGEVKNLAATLAKGRKAIAKGTLASLNGTGKVALKVAAKKVKKGSYTLKLRGTDTAGRTATGSVQLKIAK